jgi:hypothetical protein
MSFLARDLVRKSMLIPHQVRGRLFRDHPYVLRFLARLSAYLIALLLAAVWLAQALDTLWRPLFDIGRLQVGDIVIKVAGSVLAPDQIVPFAHLLAELKLMVGVLLLVALVGAVIEKFRFGSCDDALLDVALFVAALATVAGTLPGLVHGGALLLGSLGEMILCVAASGFAIYGRGYLIREELPPPVRPPLGYAPIF